MAEVLVEFSQVLTARGVRYRAHACAAPMEDGKWQGWVEFLPIDGGQPIRSARETTQPNRQDALYWATGLTAVYLEGALERALNPLIVQRNEPGAPIFSEPGQTVHLRSAPSATPEAVVDPFAVYEKEGEAILRRELGALARWHLVNIIQKYKLSDGSPFELNTQSVPALIERIVVAVRAEEIQARRRVPR